MRTVDEVRRFLNPGFAIDGVLLTMYDERTNLARQVAEEVRSVFGDLEPPRFGTILTGLRQGMLVPVVACAAIVVLQLVIIRALRRSGAKH